MSCDFSENVMYKICKDTIKSQFRRETQAGNSVLGTLMPRISGGMFVKNNAKDTDTSSPFFLFSLALTNTHTHIHKYKYIQIYTHTVISTCIHTYIYVYI